LRYFQCAEAKMSALPGSGRIATAMGKLDAQAISICWGARKELLITSGGLKVHPETIEQELNNSPTSPIRSFTSNRMPAPHLRGRLVRLAARRRGRVKKFVNSLPSAKKRPVRGSHLRR